ncbi:DNA alkylation repair protein [Sinorhizobium terangae]|uniref:DNA alkylation repair protein n=1 Tax=Sinorhizobium terangae TaxID=110322 RepID=A0A6N7LBT3_SINTE|nr:DNA alkylation repair protein [Sinorhizobium terangae]MBB4188342.1 3-methyladenine DNA glycosylase AlkC [Sinorhizobium terangae]MQX15307.1 DNA alkylation repair protein [Sinorhizobium terangae]WFU46656.1 DNA alkylation repair protein [Sinorhizobium terangae]
MAEPLKNLLHPGVVLEIATHLGRSAAAFDRERFIALATHDLDALELMQRSRQICDAFFQTLPEDFPAAAEILQRALPRDDVPGLSGWALLPVNQFIEARGLDHFELSLSLLRRLTPHFTAEFGIRAFIRRDQQRAITTISSWTGDSNHHVRRLASEGTRPRLPWAMRLPELIRDPRPILPIIAALIDDPEDYVRRSVANSLNDIAKDHPDLVAEFVAAHVDGASPERLRLLRHACRTLLKQGHVEALANFGFGTLSGIDASLTLGTPLVRLGEHLRFGLGIRNSDTAVQKVMIDFAVHHQKANGTMSPKVFKWTTMTLKPGAALEIEKSHPIRPITTRRYYAGAHRVVVLINGQPVAGADFELVID